MLRLSLVFLLLITLFGALAGCNGREAVDVLVWNGTVLTMNPEREVIEQGAVAVRGERIVAVGRAEELRARYRAAKEVDARGGLILPGLINTHTHAAMSLLRGAADDRALEDWLTNYIFPLEAKLVDGEFVYWGTMLAAAEMLEGGVTTFVDMYYFEDRVAEAARDAGIRVVAGETVIGFPAPDFATPSETLAWTKEFIEKWKGDPLVVPAVAPHSPYTVAPEVLQASAELAREQRVPLLIHVAETERELGEVREMRRATPVGYLAGLGVFEAQTLAAHCVWVDEQDRATLAEHGVGCAHNPSSNTKLASGISPVPELRAAGVAVGLGTDGPAGSNNDFNLFEEMDLAAKLQKVRQMDPTVLPAEAAVAMATIEGARAVGLDEEIGSLEAGKRADLIVVRRDGWHAVPYYDDAYSQLVYALKAGDVATTVVNGQVVYDRGRFRSVPVAELGRRVEGFAKRVREVLAAR